MITKDPAAKLRVNDATLQYLASFHGTSVTGQSASLMVAVNPDSITVPKWCEYFFISTRYIAFASLVGQQGGKVFFTSEPKRLPETYFVKPQILRILNTERVKEILREGDTAALAQTFAPPDPHTQPSNPVDLVRAASVIESMTSPEAVLFRSGMLRGFRPERDKVVALSGGIASVTS